MQMSKRSPTKISKIFHQLKFTFSHVHEYQNQTKKFIIFKSLNDQI